VGKVSWRHGKRQLTVAKIADISSPLMVGVIQESAGFVESKGINDRIKEVKPLSLQLPEKRTFRQYVRKVSIVDFPKEKLTEKRRKVAIFV
jgi:hypothetical protein